MPPQILYVLQSIILDLLKDIDFQIKRWLQNSNSYLPNL
jgi:hypothetical protein